MRAITVLIINSFLLFLAMAGCSEPSEEITSYRKSVNQAAHEEEGKIITEEDKRLDQEDSDTDKADIEDENEIPPMGSPTSGITTATIAGIWISANIDIFRSNCSFDSKELIKSGYTKISKKSSTTVSYQLCEDITCKNLVSDASIATLSDNQLETKVTNIIDVADYQPGAKCIINTTTTATTTFSSTSQSSSVAKIVGTWKGSSCPKTSTGCTIEWKFTASK